MHFFRLQEYTWPRGREAENLKYFDDHRLCEREQLKQALRKHGHVIYYVLQRSELETPESLEELALCAAQSTEYILADLRGFSFKPELEPLYMKRFLEASKTNGLCALRFAAYCWQEDLQMLTCAVKAKTSHNARSVQNVHHPCVGSWDVNLRDE